MNLSTYCFLRRYPTQEQYTTIVNGILNHLKIEREPKTSVNKSEI